MAERVDPSEVETKKAGAPPKYPWTTWMDGGWWRLTEGEDYTVSTRSFRSIAQQHGRRHGYVINTHLTADGLMIRFLSEDVAEK